MRPKRDDEDDENDWHEVEDDDADEGYIPCPHCGGTMLEAADHCPACDRWITNEDLPNKRHAWWVVVVVVILLATAVISILPM
jgi:hypothetical protein